MVTPKRTYIFIIVSGIKWTLTQTKIKYSAKGVKDDLPMKLNKLMEPRGVAPKFHYYSEDL